MSHVSYVKYLYFRREPKKGTWFRELFFSSFNAYQLYISMNCFYFYFIHYLKLRFIDVNGIFFLSNNVSKLSINTFFTTWPILPFALKDHEFHSISFYQCTKSPATINDSKNIGFYLKGMVFGNGVINIAIFVPCFFRWYTTN